MNETLPPVWLAGGPSMVGFLEGMVQVCRNVAEQELYPEEKAQTLRNVACHMEAIAKSAVPDAVRACHALNVQNPADLEPNVWALTEAAVQLAEEAVDASDALASGPNLVLHDLDPRVGALRAALAPFREVV